MAGIIGPAAVAAASIQAAIALRFLTAQRPTGVLGHTMPEAGLVVGDLWEMTLDRIAVSRDPNCPCCGLKQFDFLSMPGRQTTTLCGGRNAVQVRPAFESRPDFKALAGRLGLVGTVRVNDQLLRLDAPPYELTLFEDGRAIVKGTADPMLARSLVARWVGI
jgi:adenylyltransferase/sulfurtransferase